MINSNNTIFTTGAFLRPQKVVDINGNNIWMWTVAEFIDDSFQDGEIFNPPEIANNLDELLVNTTNDD